jgi:hypothetical protein
MLDKLLPRHWLLQPSVVLVRMRHTREYLMRLVTPPQRLLPPVGLEYYKVAVKLLLRWLVGR